MEFLIDNLDEIGVVAQQFIQAIGNHKILAFHGSMGAGKTTFIKALCEKLGVKNSINSPTFAIVNEYEGRLPLYHYDVYRISCEEEMEDTGYEDYFYGEGVCLVEWANLIEELMPEKTCRIVIEKDLEKGFDYRRITIEEIK